MNAPTSEPAHEQDDAPPLDRGIPSVNRVRSMQSRVTTVLSAGVVVLFAGALLTWYYSGTFTSNPTVRPHTVKREPQGDAPLPPLTRASSAAAEGREADDPPVIERLLGDAPPLAADSSADESIYKECLHPDDCLPAVEAVGVPVAEPAPDPALLRRLSGSTYLTLSRSAADRTESLDAQLLDTTGADRDSGAAAGSVRSLLKSSVIPTVQAQRLPDERLLLAKGTPLSCTLLTAVDTALPGLTTCSVDRDVYGADGTVVLIERGSALFGETRSVGGGTGARVFIVWEQLRSQGVVAQLDSPATDQLGRSGLPGAVDRHFLERFGASLLTSVIEGQVRRLSQPQGDATVIYSPQEQTSITTEVLRSTASIPTTVRVPQGARIQVLVARDVDFASVYALELANPSP